MSCIAGATGAPVIWQRLMFPQPIALAAVIAGTAATVVTARTGVGGTAGNSTRCSACTLTFLTMAIYSARSGTASGVRPRFGKPPITTEMVAVAAAWAVSRGAGHPPANIRPLYLRAVRRHRTVVLPLPHAAAQRLPVAVVWHAVVDS